MQTVRCTREDAANLSAGILNQIKVLESAAFKLPKRSNRVIECPKHAQIVG